MNENVTTNMDLASLKSYVPAAVKFDANNIKTGMVPGDTEMCNRVSIYVANKTKTKELVAELFPEESEDSSSQEDTDKNTRNNVKIEVLNGSGKSSALNEVVSKLKNAGYTVSKQGTTNETKKTTITNRTNQDSTTTEEIKELMGAGTVSKGTNNSNVDITIVIGEDY